MRSNEQLNPEAMVLLVFGTAILIGTSTLSSFIFYHTRAHIHIHHRLADDIHSKNPAAVELLATLA